MDHKKTLTRRQYAALLFTALLSPLIRTLPRAAVAWAGRAAWLCPLCALPLAWGLTRLTDALSRGLEPGEGASSLIRRCLGPAAGRALLLVYAGGVLIYTGFVLRAGAERFAATVYQQSRPEPFMVLLLALCVPAAGGAGQTLGRTAAALGKILLPVLAGVFLLTLPDVELQNLRPLTVRDVPGGILGAFALFPVACVGALALFWGELPPPGESAGRRAGGAMLLLSAVGSLLCLETVGVFGPKLTARLSFPFFTMTRDLSLFHLAQRIEAVVVALWVFSDVVLVTLLLRCLREILGGLFRPPAGRGRWLLLVGEAAAAFLWGELFLPSAVQTLLWQDRLFPVGLTILVPGGLLLTLLVGKLRKKL